MEMKRTATTGVEVMFCHLFAVLFGTGMFAIRTVKVYEKVYKVLHVLCNAHLLELVLGWS